ncbi:Polyketide cyclase / dehydrase and lipid transport [Nocardioides sp. YR527]|uniref:type II toxin-antitoxin system Rv0910 family toxin n=1 Tax=Nocardioides sp. YR527 TaxID=1881028 RepID=UPI00088722E7|nr:SRPBCC family protein [Nocardioides sp. YR527]SDJ70504.1 Polyketide cyclase / dehydrase and lipid transport [Nocardioides sp. YR527]
MAHVDVSQEIGANQEDTWKVFSDLNSFEKWLTIHDKWYGEPPTDLTVGSTFTEQATIMGMSNKIDWVVEEFNAPSNMKISGKGLAGAQITFDLSVDPVSDTTSTASIVADFTGQMVVGAIGAAIERASDKECKASLEKLNELVS